MLSAFPVKPGVRKSQSEYKSGHSKSKERSSMNRKQRRAALKQIRQPAARPIRSRQLFAEAALCQRQNRLAEAARLYKRRAAARTRSCRGAQQSRRRAAGAGQARRSLGAFRALAQPDAAVVRSIHRNLCDAGRGVAAARHASNGDGEHGHNGPARMRVRQGGVGRCRGRPVAAVRAGSGAGPRYSVRAAADRVAGGVTRCRGEGRRR